MKKFLKPGLLGAVVAIGLGFNPVVADDGKKKSESGSGVKLGIDVNVNELLDQIGKAMAGAFETDKNHLTVTLLNMTCDNFQVRKIQEKNTGVFQGKLVDSGYVINGEFVRGAEDSLPALDHWVLYGQRRSSSSTNAKGFILIREAGPVGNMAVGFFVGSKAGGTPMAGFKDAVNFFSDVKDLPKRKDYDVRKGANDYYHSSKTLPKHTFHVSTDFGDHKKPSRIVIRITNPGSADKVPTCPGLS